MRSGEEMTREEAIKVLKNPPRVYNEDMWTALDMAIVALSTDAVQVVRCKDCKYYGTTDCQIQESFYGIKDFDYCSYGERERECEGGGDE